MLSFNFFRQSAYNGMYPVQAVLHSSGQGGYNDSMYCGNALLHLRGERRKAPESERVSL